MDNLKILLVDDEDDFINTLAERLELRGLKSLTVHDGESAIRLLDTEQFDIMLLDVMMPGMSGLETLKHVKIDHPDLPVILLTGHGSTKDGMEGMRMGAFDYLVKPVNIKDLLKKIEAALK
ncbi:MAG: response regulator [Desulfobacterales bacterium]|nr:response regulator [Desulfobacterales bacterium]